MFWEQTKRGTYLRQYIHLLDTENVSILFLIMKKLLWERRYSLPRPKIIWR